MALTSSLVLITFSVDILTFSCGCILLRVSYEPFLCVGSNRNKLKHQAVLVVFRFAWWTYTFFFGSWTETKWNWNKPNRPKWRSTGYKNKSKRKKWKNQEKNKKNVRLCYYKASCPKLLVSVQPNSENQLICSFVKQLKLASLFWIESKLVSVLVLVL